MTHADHSSANVQCQGADEGARHHEADHAADLQFENAGNKLLSQAPEEEGTLQNSLLDEALQSREDTRAKHCLNYPIHRRSTRKIRAPKRLNL